MATLGNSNQDWDRFWTQKATNFYHNLPASYIIENFIRQKLYFNAIDRLLGSFSLEGKDILELGSGTGSNSLYLAKLHNARTVTLVDFSQKALRRVRERFYSCPVIKIPEDILKLSLQKEYDFVHSTGLIEHFIGKERLLAVKKHFQFVRPEGLVMIWVPIFSPAFKLIRKINHCLGIKEIPFTKEELQLLCEKSNLKILREGKTVFGALYGILAQKRV